MSPNEYKHQFIFYQAIWFIIWYNPHCDWCDICTYITPCHSLISYPFQPQEGFLFKDTQIKRAFRRFIRVVSLPSLQNNTTSPKIERKWKHFLISWKSDLIYCNIKSKSVKLPFITKDSKHLCKRFSPTWKTEVSSYHL